MRVKTLVLLVMSVMSVGIMSIARADTALSKTQITNILDQLTKDPLMTWIRAGTITATHTEYRAPRTTDRKEVDARIQQAIQEHLSNPDTIVKTAELQKALLDAIPFNVRYEWLNEYTQVSKEEVRYDGTRFYWDIDTQSRTDSETPGTDLVYNEMSDHFRMEWNQRRSWAWDGQTYVSYALPVNHARMETAPSPSPEVHGLLRAGLIPWGLGYLSKENLQAAKASAVDKVVDGRRQVTLTLNLSGGIVLEAVLDPGKGYSALSCTRTRPGGRRLRMTYDDLVQADGRWVPKNILIEALDPLTDRLLERDAYQVQTLSTQVPPANSFLPEIQTGATIEYSSPGSEQSLLYASSPVVNSDQVLAERWAVASNEGIQPQNCGTVALSYVASRLGRAIPSAQLRGLIEPSSGKTSLYAIKRLAEQSGLYCAAVRTDLDTLEGLTGCQVILHIPGKDHFLVLGGIDARKAWVIDLTELFFLKPVDISNFVSMEWTGGVALVCSNGPISWPGMTRLTDKELRETWGGAGYACTKLLQEYRVDYCVAGCLGLFKIYEERWGCQVASTGACSNQLLWRYTSSPCVEDILEPWECAITWDWNTYYAFACM